MMSANTLTARASVRSPKISLTTPSSYPRYTKPKGFASNSNFPPRDFSSRPKTLVFQKAVKRKAALQAAKLGAKVGARFVPGLGWALIAYDLYNYAETIIAEKSAPSSATEAEWIPGYGWRYHHSRAFIDYAHDGWSYPTGVKSYATGIGPDKYFSVPWNSANRYYFYTPPTWWTGSYYRYWRSDKFVTGQKLDGTPLRETDNPWGYEYVEALVPKLTPQNAAAPFPSSPTTNKPRYQRSRRPRFYPRYEVVPATSPGPNPANSVVELSIETGTPRVTVRTPRGGRGGRKERKSKAKLAGIALARLYGGLTEAAEFWEIVKENFEVPDGLSLLEEFQFIADNFENMDWGQFIVDLALNEIEDRVVGSIHGAMKPGFSNLEFGTLGKINLAN